EEKVGSVPPPPPETASLWGAGPSSASCSAIKTVIEYLHVLWSHLTGCHIPFRSTAAWHQGRPAVTLRRCASPPGLREGFVCAPPLATPYIQRSPIALLLAEDIYPRPAFCLRAAEATTILSTARP